MPVTAGTRISDGTVVWEVKDTRVVNDIDSANDNLDGLMSIEDFNKLTTLQNKYGPTGGPAGIDVIPSTSSVLTYDGSSKSPTWTNYNTALLTIGGQTSGINAGTYGATFTPTERYVWNDGSKAARTVYWTINKGSTTITTSEESVTISSVSDTTYEVSVSSNNTDGSITVQSSNTNVVTVTYNTSTNKVIIEMVGTGTANITINQAEGSNRLAGTKTIAVNVSLITTFAELTPAQIQTIVRQGKAAQYWNVGDLHAISFNGTINGTNTITLNDETLYCYIIGIDHNSEREGSNRLHLGLYKAAENDSYKQICLDAARMNSTNTNAGGWASCEMRTSRMPEVLATFPSAWQNVISNTTKYTDNTGGGVDDASYVTATTDKCFLFSEVELLGQHVAGNNAEPNYCKQYDYYANGNPLIYYYKNNTSAENQIWYSRTACIIGADANQEPSEYFLALVYRSSDSAFFLWPNGAAGGCGLVVGFTIA